MRESFVFIDTDEAILKLKSMKKAGIKRIPVCLIDFDSGKSKKQKKTIEESCVIVQKANAVIYNGDKYVPHIMAFSQRKKDLDLDNPKGIMHDLLIVNKLLE